MSGQAAHAQAAPVQYLTAGLPAGTGVAPSSGTTAAGFEDNPNQYKFGNGWFVSSEQSISGPDFGYAMSGPGTLTSQGMQFGYDFKGSNNVPMKVFGGFDTLKYNNGIGGSDPFAGTSLSAFTSQSNNLQQGYNAHAGVAFQPSSNVTLSVGMGFSQLPAQDLNSQLVRSADPFAFNGH
jgi:opacity protein-like surface antigen